MNHQKIFIIFIIVLCGVGIIIRCLHLIYIDPTLPAHSGGLFLSFIEAILNNGYRIPATIPYYTERGIPFAYPPLPFYIGALLLQITHINPFLLINILSPIIAALTVPATYLVAKTITQNKKLKASIITAFVLIPSTFREQIDDEGMAEALGTLALLILFFTIFTAHKKSSVRNIFLIGVSAAFCVLAAPGSAYAAILILATCSLCHFFDEKVKTIAIKNIILVFITTIVLTSFYWLPVLQNHGMSLFIKSFSGQHPSTSMTSIILDLIQANVTRAKYPFIWNGLLFTGLISIITTRRIIWAMWLLLLYLIPGEGGWLASVPAAFITGYGIYFIYERVITVHFPDRLSTLARHSILLVIMLFFAGYALLNVKMAINDVRALSQPDDAKSILTVSEWIHTNTAPEIPIIILKSHLREWSPRLFERTVLNVPQGTEWEPETALRIDNFNTYIGRCTDHACLKHAAKKYFDVDNFIVFLQASDTFTFLNDNFSTQDKNYAVLYKAEGLLIGNFSTLKD